MKTLLLAALLASLPAFLHAQLVVYRESETARVTVAGRQVTLPVITYIIYDTALQSFSAIGSFQVGGNKYYAITNNSENRLTQGIAGPGGNYTVVSHTADGSDDPNVITASYFAKGRETTLDLGNAATATLPRSLKATTRAVQWSGGRIGIYEGSSTVIFQSAETKFANQAGENAAAVIERIRQRLENRGYVSAP
jgi:hypothetical protein